MRFGFAFLLAVLASVASAYADDKPTVESLLKQGFELKGVFPSNAGPGLILQKGGEIDICFVAETAKSPDIVTQYCKPVH